MEEQVLSFEEAAVWALYYKEKYGKSRRVSISEIKAYAKEVLHLAKDMFDYQASFKSGKAEIDKFVKEYQADVKFKEIDSTIRLKTYAKTKYLLKEVAQNHKLSFELHHALSDEHFAHIMFEPKEQERQ